MINSATFNWSDTINLSIEDNYTLTIYDEDIVNNNNTKSTWFVYDISEPTFSLSRSPDPSYNTNNITLNVQVSENFQVDTVFIAHNISGSLINYSTTKTGVNYSLVIFSSLICRNSL